MMEEPDQSEPMGTFEDSAAVPGQISRLVLMADGTFHQEVVSVCPLHSFGCAPEQTDGLYKRSATGDIGHLDFMTANGDVITAFDYTYDGATLKVLRDGTTDWQALARAPVAWCSTAPQCEQQWLSTPLCFGEWACVNNGCQLSCRDL